MTGRPMRLGVGAVAAWLTTAILAAGQPAGGVTALRAALEGRHVVLKIDMPATSSGVDLFPQREPDIDAEAYGLRLRVQGTAIRRGDRVPITLIKVNKKNIEVQLAGGGYGVSGDPIAIRATPYVPKSTRETNLEYERDRTRDEARKRAIERELAVEQNERAQRQLEAARKADVAYELKKAEIAARRLEKGSRFNVWYPDKRLEQWVPTAEELMFALASYAQLAPGAARPGAALTGTATPAPPSPTEYIRKGLGTGEVYTMLGGFPARRRPIREGGLQASIDTWEKGGQVIEVTFVEGVVTNVVVTPRRP